MQEPSRKEIWRMFDQIASTYDRVNRLMTFGLDRYWRKNLCRHLPARDHLHILDSATGTGDQIISLMNYGEDFVEKIVGIDLASAMVEIARKKLEKKPYADKVSFQVASALELPFPDQTFDCITISFGIRNVTDVPQALREALRVLKPKGRLLILEGTVPSNPLLKIGHLLYLRHLLPRMGGWISKKKSAYSYLNQTIESFPSGEQFLQLMKEAGFVATELDKLTGGAVTVYRGDRFDETELKSQPR